MPKLYTWTLFLAPNTQFSVLNKPTYINIELPEDQLEVTLRGCQMSEPLNLSVICASGSDGALLAVAMRGRSTNGHPMQWR